MVAKVEYKAGVKELVVSVKMMVSNGCESRLGSHNLGAPLATITGRTRRAFIVAPLKPSSSTLQTWNDEATTDTAQQCDHHGVIDTF